MDVIAIKKSWQTFILICFIFSCTGAVADDITSLRLKDDTSYLIRPHAFTLHNNTGREFVFFMGAVSSELSRQKIPQDQIKEYSDGRSDRYLIELPTAGYGEIRYFLHSGKRYQIYWNSQAYRWDLFELEARQ